MKIFNEKNLNLPAGCIPAEYMNSIDSALHTAISVAKQNRPVAIFSQEMSAEQLTEKLISLQAGFPAGSMMTENITAKDWDRISDALETASQYPIFLDDTADITAGSIREKVRHISDIALVILLLSDSDDSSALQAVAAELDVAVMVLP